MSLAKSLCSLARPRNSSLALGESFSHFATNASLVNFGFKGNTLLKVRSFVRMNLISRIHLGAYADSHAIALD
jgi:hypothetical protein